MYEIRHYRTGTLLFGVDSAMALFALYGAFAVQFVAGDADGMCGILVPVFNSPNYAGSCVTVETFIVQLLLMFPVFERKYQVSHFKPDDFRAGIYTLRKDTGRYQSQQADRNYGMSHRSVSPFDS